MDGTSLRVEGEVRRPQDFDFAALAALPGQVPDVGAVIPGREGGGVWLRSLLQASGVQPGARHITLQATDGNFSASVPLAAVEERAVVVYRLGDVPLPVEQGGPLRFLIKDVEACATGEVDACANVKFLGAIALRREAGTDTRPTTARTHEALHEQDGQRHLES